MEPAASVTDTFGKLLGRQNRIKFMNPTDPGLVQVQKLLIQRIRSVDGSSLIVEIHVADLEFQGAPAYLALITDISHRREAEVESEQIHHSGVFGGMSARLVHEINEPLQSVLGYSELAKKTGGPEIQDILHRVSSNGARAAKVVRDLSTFGSPPTPVMQDANVQDTVQKAVDVKAADFKKLGIELRVEFGTELPSVVLDQDQIVDAILNVLTNAQHAVEEADRPGLVELEVGETEGLIRIIIRDNGTGISPEISSNIFDPFFTSRQFGKGIGLGLTIAREIARIHDGDILVESDGATGTTVSIELPVVQSADEVARADIENLPLRASSGLNVLVAEDEPDVREFMSVVLQDAGHRVDVVPDGEAAWESIKSGSYDCVLLDLRMPGLDGEELYRRLDESNTFHMERIVFVTGDTLTQTTQEFIAATGNQFLRKPFSVAELNDQIETVKRTLS